MSIHQQLGYKLAPPPSLAAVRHEPITQRTATMGERHEVPQALVFSKQPKEQTLCHVAPNMATSEPKRTQNPSLRTIGPIPLQLPGRYATSTITRPGPDALNSRSNTSLPTMDWSPTRQSGMETGLQVQPLPSPRRHHDSDPMQPPGKSARTTIAGPGEDAQNSRGSTVTSAVSWEPATWRAIQPEPHEGDHEDGNSTARKVLRRVGALHKISARRCGARTNVGFLPYSRPRKWRKGALRTVASRSQTVNRTISTIPVISLSTSGKEQCKEPGQSRALSDPGRARGHAEADESAKEQGRLLHIIWGRSLPEVARKG